MRTLAALIIIVGGTATHASAQTPADSANQPAQVLEEIVVTGARREQRLADVTVTTEIINRREIEASGAADLAAVLTEQTGIQFQEGHPSGAGIMLQGLSSERVLVLLDGQPLYGRISGNFDLARIPTSAVERVEVVKGPQATLYGSEAMGGVVNIITRDAAAGTWGGVGRITAGTEGRLDGGVTGGLARGDFSALVDLGLRNVDRAPGRAQELGALTERADGIVKLGWITDSNLALEATAMVVDERQRWQSGSLFDFADNTQVSARVGARWRRGMHRLAPTFYFSSLDHLARQSSLPSPIAGTGDRQRQRLLEAELLYSGPLLGHVADAGVEVKREYISSTDGRIEGGDRSLASVEPFAQYEWTSGSWSILPGARLTWNQQWGTTLAPRLALRYRVGPALSLRTSIGRGFRAPDFKELYLQFTNEAAGYAVYGNRDLRPEHSTNLTAGAEWTPTGGYARAQLFWNELRDFIETRPLPSTGEQLLFTYDNVDRSRTGGVDLESGVFLGALRLETGYSYLTTRDNDTGEPLLGRPAHSGRASAGYALDSGPRLMVTALYTGETPMQRDTSGAVTGVRDAFFRVDLHAAQALPGGVVLTLGADNVFDARPAQWAEAVGRRVYAGLSWNFTRTFRE